MVTSLGKKIYTISEYLEFEDQAEVRHEFIEGKIIPMAGGTTNHNEIITNLCLLLKPPLRQQKGKVYTENVRLWIPSANLFTYPDVMVIAGEPIYYSDTKTTVTNPMAVIEVLSDSTRDYDLGRKFGYYLLLDTLRRHFILMSPIVGCVSGSVTHRKGMTAKFISERVVGKAFISDAQELPRTRSNLWCWVSLRSTQPTV